MYGLVVTDRPGSDSEILHAIFIDCRSPLLFIKRSPRVDCRSLSKEEKKALYKLEREKELRFGDWISFDEHDVMNRYISNFRKEYPLCESRVTTEHLQVETVCVFSPIRGRESPKCFSDTLGLISVQKEIAENFFADVALRCWISVEVNHVESVDFSFGEFIEIADDQSSVYSTPWNRANHRYVVEIHSVEDESDKHNDKGSSCSGISMPHVLKNMTGLRTSDHRVLCFNYRHVPFHLAYCPPNGSAALGDTIIFDAYYSQPLGAYMIGTFKKRGDMLSIGWKMINFGSLPVLELRVSRSDLPFGYLRAMNTDLGLVYDPSGFLTAALLNAPKETVFEVYVADTGPSAFSRLIIKDISEKTAKFVKSCEAIAYKPLHEVEGITLGSAQVFAREYAMLKINFGSSSMAGWEELKPGTWIKFSATSENGPPHFMVQKWMKTFEYAAEPIKHIFIDDEYMFQTTCHYREDFEVLESQAFGFIDDPNQICSTKKSGESVTLWVKKGDTEARTPFVVCSMEKPISICTVEGCIAGELLRKVLQIDGVQKAILNANANELLTHLLA